jgi:hypothetical protein
MASHQKMGRTYQWLDMGNISDDYDFFLGTTHRLKPPPQGGDLRKTRKFLLFSQI